eukprot:TRINITY_DN5831_c0_g1_i1.p1 TRINITY_DN5831_c0_g1~~TRINITY_DN5831_c0_g1_i1.p1  ORF type:complete len:329 (+),score=150.08 TRINITY_DN5831_c0_g1_i1:75-1061(+)
MSSPMAEAPCGKDVAEFLQRVDDGAKVTSELLQLSRKQIHTDEKLREDLSNGAVMMQEWQMSSKILGERFREEVTTLCNQISVSKHAQHRLLVDKRKLQMSMIDMKRKCERSEEQLNEIIAKYDALAEAQKDEAAREQETLEGVRAEKDGAVKRAVALEAMVKQLEGKVEDDKKKDETIDELRDKVANLMTQVEANKEQAAESDRREASRSLDKKGSFAESAMSMPRAELNLANLASRGPALHHPLPSHPSRKGTFRGDDVMSLGSSVPASSAQMYRPASVRKLRTAQSHSKQQPLQQPGAVFAAGVAGGGLVALIVVLALKGGGTKE